MKKTNPLRTDAEPSAIARCVSRSQNPGRSVFSGEPAQLPRCAQCAHCVGNKLPHCSLDAEPVLPGDFCARYQKGDSR